MRSLIALLLLSCCIAKGQPKSNGVIVDYTQTTNFDFVWKTYYKLHASNIESISIEILPEIKGDYLGSKASDGSSTSNMVSVKNKDNTPGFFYKLYGNPVVKLRENHLDNIMYVADTVQLNWEIHADTKLITDFVCNKATVNFRGRDYVAWYTKQIPIPAGPYKFSGLPGLILTIESLDKEVFVEATAISYGAHDVLNTQDLTPLDVKILSIERLNLKREKINEEFMKKIHAKSFGTVEGFQKCEDCVSKKIEYLK